MTTLPDAATPAGTTLCPAVLDPGMDRRTLGERLPGDRIRRRLPVGRPGEDDDRPDEEGTTDDEATGDGDEDDDGVAVPDVDLSTDDDGGRRLRSLLLALAGLGAVVTIVAVIAQFVLNRGDDDEDGQAGDTRDDEGVVSGDDDAEADATDEVVTDTDDGTDAGGEADVGEEIDTDDAEADIENPDDGGPDEDVEEAEGVETVGQDGTFEEGTAALVGLAFLLGVAAVRRWLDTSAA